MSCPNCCRAGVAPTRKPGLEVLRDVARLGRRDRDDRPDGQHRGARAGSVQPAAAKTDAMPRSVTSVMPDVGCDDTPTMPTMRAATVTNRTPKTPTPAAQHRALQRRHVAGEDAGHEARDEHHQSRRRRTTKLPGRSRSVRVGDAAAHVASPPLHAARDGGERARHRRQAPQHREDARGRHGAGADVADVARPDLAGVMSTTSSLRLGRERRVRPRRSTR